MSFNDIVLVVENFCHDRDDWSCSLGKTLFLNNLALLANRIHFHSAGRIMPHHVSPSDSDAVFVSSLVTGLVSIPVVIAEFRVVGPLPRIFLVVLVESNPELFLLGVRESRVQSVVNIIGLNSTGDSCKVIIVSGTSSFSIMPG